MLNQFKKNTKVINGHNYEIMPFPALYNYNLTTRFGATVGSSFRNILATFSGQDETNSMAELGSGIYTLLNALHTKDPKGELVLEILSQTTRDGKAINKVTFDDFYTGNMEEMMEALIESINVHFKSFLPKGQFSGLLTTQETTTAESSAS